MVFLYLHIKRIVDFLVGLLALPFVILAFLFIAPVIYFTDRGPIFYTAPRRGKDAKVFLMYKFRSMRVHAPDIRNADGSTYNGDDDPRVTRIGRLLRKTSLDELPQFFNVLKGDMSLIGPRPTLATKEIDWDTLDENRRLHYAVRPGITGYSQAYYRNSITQEEKFENDAYYAAHVSFLLDVRIVFKTVFSVLKHENINITADYNTAVRETEKLPAMAGTENDA